MFFERLNIRGFGCLRTEITFATDRLNLTIANNEAGKSTLVEALLAAFYGIEEDERRTTSRKPRRKNVIPWTEPEKFGLTLDFTANKVRWRIERDFHEGVVKLINRDTDHDSTSDYQRGHGDYAFGEELIGLSCGDFLKSFYLKQEEIHTIQDAGGLTPHIQRVATAREGGATSENAIERLREALRHYPYPNSRDGLMIDNAIKRFKSERESLLQEMDRFERQRNDIEPQSRRLATLDSDLAKLNRERKKDEKLGDLSEIRELDRLVEAQERLHGESEELKSEVEDLKEYDQFPASRWEQLNNLSGRVEELTTSVASLEERLVSEIEEPLEKLETELQSQGDIAGVTVVQLQEFEAAVSRLGDRTERVNKARKEHDNLDKNLQDRGFDRGHYTQLKQNLAGFNLDEQRFIDEFRATYAQEEVVYRDVKTRRELLERERDLIVDRRQRVAATTRMLFIIAAVLVIAGGVMILMTHGEEWLGQVLAGLGGIFGAVGAIVRGTVGGSETSGLKKLETEYQEADREEEKARDQLNAIGQELTSLATRAAFEDGNELLTEFDNFERLQEMAEPLFEAERNLERVKGENKDALEAVRPFFERAGDKVPEEDGAIDTARALLERYREIIRLSDQFKQLKDNKVNLEEELNRKKRDRNGQRELCGDILRLGSIVESEPLDEAVDAFRESLEKHRRYRSIVDDHLPRIERELLPEVDINAKRDRLSQLREKTSGAAEDTSIEHSKEFYRDRADRSMLEVQQLTEERLKIHREIGLTFDRYQSHYPGLQQRLQVLEQAVERAEAYRSEVETAIGIMGDISRKVYKSWAAALSEEAAPFLRSLNPRYGDLKFNEDLTFTIRDLHQERTIRSNEVEILLSTGARDEVFLAARLSIACYLAKGAKGTNPIVLDEPLSAADDEKFESGMIFFTETLSQRHQVLIMSCHTERHRWLNERIPEMWEARVYPIELVAQEEESEES